MEGLFFILALAAFGGGFGAGRASAGTGTHSGHKSGGSQTNLTVWYKDRKREQKPAIIPTTKTTRGTYTNGELIGFQAPDIYGSTNVWYLRADALDAFNSAINSVGSNGANFPLIIDAYRTTQQQNDAHKRKPDLATVAEYSLHTRGLALDLRAHPGHGKIFVAEDESTWGSQELMTQHLAKFGWKKTVNEEPWHYEYQA